MEKMKLGDTGIMASRTAFGALPLQRRRMDDAVRILRRAYDAGINFYDTARAYTDSEEKIGLAFEGMRHDVHIATKSGARDAKTLRAHLETSLRMLRTDYVDIFQFHNHLPPDELVDAARGFVKEGKALHVGLTLHAREDAQAAVAGGKFETLQFPFSSISDEGDAALVRSCEAAGMGFIAMKAMAGGLIRDVESNFAFIRSFGGVLPIWGVQRMEELEQFIRLEADPPALDQARLAAIEAEKAELGGQFCRGCGYCMPCPAGIELSMVCRMDLLLGRAVAESFMAPEWRAKMALVAGCTGCHACAGRCPYHLEPHELAKRQLSYYEAFAERFDAESGRGNPDGMAP